MKKLEISKSPAVLRTDTLFTWYSKTAQTDCQCRLRIYKNSCEQFIIIASELPNNPGSSITDEASKLINLVCYQFGLSTSKVMWVEHYPAGYLKDEETYDLVMQGLGCVHSQGINKQKLELFLGVEL